MLAVERKIMSDGIAADAITNAKILNGTILNADISAACNLARVKMETDAALPHQMLTPQLCNEDGTVMTAAGAAGTFHIVAGTWGGDSYVLQGENVSGGVENTVARSFLSLPPEYIAGACPVLVILAKYSGTGAAGVVQVDAESCEFIGDGTFGPDRVTTAAQNLTNAFAAYSFTLEGTVPDNLVPGNGVMTLIRTSIEETGGVNNLRAELAGIALLLNVQG